jgi:hypothetical protein
LKGFTGVATADNGDNVDEDEVDEDDVGEGETDEAIDEAYIDVEVVAEGHQKLVPLAPGRTSCRGDKGAARDVEASMKRRIME